jgi:signal transduction histidine kinase
MRTAKDEWELTFNAIPELVAIIDRDHRLLRVNRAMAEFIGCPPAEAVGLRCCEVMHRLPHPPGFCPHTLLLRDGSSHQIEAFDEAMGGHFEISVVPFYGQDGTTLLGSIHVAKNIDERKLKEDEQTKLQAQLLQAQKLESIGQLAAGIAHEINTPIQFISANNDFLADSFHGLTQLVAVFLRLYQAAGKQTVDSDLLKEVAQTVEEIDWEYLAEEIPLTLEQNKNGVQRVASIVMAMKEFSHPGSKEKELRNINKLLDITITVARNEWKYVAEVITDFDPNLPEMVCNADELNQVFLNIIVNAAHAIEDKLGNTPATGKGTIRITTRQPEKGLLEIRISDTGGGIPEPILEKVFDPFFTTKKQGRGTGQGLAIARTIVENRHGGRIHIETENDVGTTFVLQFPVKPARSQ